MKLDNMIDFAKMCSKCVSIQDGMSEGDWWKIYDWLSELKELRDLIKRIGMASNIENSIFINKLMEAKIQIMADKIRSLEMLENSRILDSLEHKDET